MKLPLEKILIKDRIREDIGDIGPLKESMHKYGLLNPITVNRDHELVAGFRRLMAAKSLGWHEIECNVLDVKSKLDLLLVEAAENNTRKDFTPEEQDKFIQRKYYLSLSFFGKIFHLIKMFIKWIISLFAGANNAG